MNPKYARYAQRLREVIAQGEQVARLERPGQHVPPYIQDKEQLHAWLVNVDHIIRAAFGTEGAHFIHFNKATERAPEHSYEVNRIVGILKGALSDLEGGFLVRQEHLVAGVVFDSVLEQARYLTKNDFKDPAAVLCRVVLEDCLRRLCRDEHLPDSGKAAALNDALLAANRYTKPQWRQIQSWLDIGNAAAHGKFSDYDNPAVIQMIDGVERFVAQELGI
jgi:hypothetical protein